MKENVKLIIIYLIICLASILSFWIIPNLDAFVYSIFILYIISPISILMISISMSRSIKSKKKYLIPILFGIMHMLIEYLTFSLANMISFDKINQPEYIMILYGFIISIIGYLIGDYLKKKQI